MNKAALLAQSSEAVSWTLARGALVCPRPRRTRVSRLGEGARTGGRAGRGPTAGLVEARALGLERASANEGSVADLDCVEHLGESKVASEDLERGGVFFRAFRRDLSAPSSATNSPASAYHAHASLAAISYEL